MLVNIGFQEKKSIYVYLYQGIRSFQNGQQGMLIFGLFFCREKSVQDTTDM